MDIKIIKFPSAQAGLPDGFESLEPSKEVWMDVISKFGLATSLLQEPLEQLLQEFKPACLVADFFFPWATDAAKKFGIPRLVFHGTSFFSLCMTECLRLYEPFKRVESDDEPFVVPNLPGEIELTRKKIPDFLVEEIETDMTKMFKASEESELKSYGVVVNSFYELEASYADFYRNFLGRKAWHIGPVSLCNKGIEDKAERGRKASIDEDECLKWLDSKKTNTVVHICFGSMARVTSTQLKEIAMGLEDSGQEFIWVVKLDKGNEEEERLPERFEERTKEKGLIIRAWAPQVLILEHPAVGGFVTHCGWNSTLEGISAGVPMVTWPIAAEQFYNEKLVTDFLKIGVAVGVKHWVSVVGDFVNRDEVGKAVKAIMVGEKAEELRSRAKAFGDTAKRAVEKDGSSYSDLNALIQELSLHQGH
ncbi:hypothetical protein SLEP1_g32473 [Rubroshorea leprosula]|uniref:Glycosyltransferase n=1 Tax=Rubroshorea leprosula TaxID=152421 RepID=A0AAV5KDE5_9ROSI|nr:hypothetical protein SLEP1_g32473 [Rubroshorea leprosula]